MSVLALCMMLALPSAADLDRALDEAEPPPALRASFRAELSTSRAVRRIEFDPYADPGQRFRTTCVTGDDPELDAVVAALTGYLYLVGGTEEIGDEGGRIVVPKV